MLINKWEPYCKAFKMKKKKKSVSIHLKTIRWNDRKRVMRLSGGILIVALPMWVRVKERKKKQNGQKQVFLPFQSKVCLIQKKLSMITRVYCLPNAECLCRVFVSFTSTGSAIKKKTDINTVLQQAITGQINVPKGFSQVMP